MLRNIESGNLVGSNCRHQTNPEHFPEFQSSSFYLTRTKIEDQTRRKTREEAKDDLSGAWKSSPRSVNPGRIEVCVHTEGTRD
jgi:hypothetical protein